MPFDLAAVERGYGECVATWQGNEIRLRYNTGLDNRALVALKRALVGAEMLGGVGRIPDVEACVDELVRVLLPCGPNVPEHERGWDVTRDGQPVPIDEDSIIALPLGLPAALLAAVFGDIMDPNRARPSNAGSSPAGSSEGRHPTTTSPSPTPDGPASVRGSSSASMALVNGPAGASG